MIRTTNIEQLAQEHIREHESRLKRIDELFEQVEQRVPDTTAIDAELAELRRERERLLQHVEALRRRTRAEWQENRVEQLGPMVVWDAVAKRLEKLLERVAG